MEKINKNKAAIKRAKVIFATALFLSLYLPGAYPLPQIDEVVNGTVQVDQVDGARFTLAVAW